MESTGKEVFEWKAYNNKRLNPPLYRIDAAYVEATLLGAKKINCAKSMSFLMEKFGRLIWKSGNGKENLGD